MSARQCSFSPFSTFAHPQHVLVQTLLGRLLPDVVVGAQLEEEVAQVVGCDLDGHVDHLALLVGLDDDAGGELSPGLIGAWLLGVEGVPADSALAAVQTPLGLPSDLSDTFTERCCGSLHLVIN